MAVTPYFCATASGLAGHLVDPAGNEWSPDDLRLAEHAAFRDKYHRLARDPRDKVAQVGESTPVTTDVWFTTRQEDDDKVPPKPVLLAMNHTDRDLVLAAQRLATADRAKEVAAMIEDVAPSIQVRPDSPAFIGGGPVLQIVGDTAYLRAVGDLDDVIDVGLTLLAKDDVPMSEAWYGVDNLPIMAALGVDGDGVSVADFLGSPGPYDTTYLAMASGSCHPPVGSDYQCFCPAAAPSAQPASSAPVGHSPCGYAHMQHALSVIKNTWSTLSGGAARHSSPLAVNGNVACANSTIDQEVYWAVYQNGANIVNRSASNGLSTSRYFDYWMTKSPYPTFVASSGNDRGTVASLLRNGPVVGGADDHGSTSRTGLTMYDFGAGNGSAWQNYSTGWELPHVVAPAVNIDTVRTSRRPVFVNAPARASRRPSLGHRGFVDGNQPDPQDVARDRVADVARQFVHRRVA